MKVPRCPTLLEASTPQSRIYPAVALDQTLKMTKITNPKIRVRMTLVGGTAKSPWQAL